MLLNISNIEKLIFWDSELEKKLPNLENIFFQYKLGTQNPGLKNLARDAVIKLLESISDEYLKILREYFNEEVKIERLDTHIIYDYQFNAEELESKLQEVTTTPNCFLSRINTKIYISFWR